MRRTRATEYGEMWRYVEARVQEEKPQFQQSCSCDVPTTTAAIAAILTVRKSANGISRNAAGDRQMGARRVNQEK